MTDPQPLQFDRPEFQPGVSTGATCALCKQAVVQNYYEVNGRVVCSLCREKLEQGTEGSRMGRLLKATFAGLGVTIVGAVIWWAVRTYGNYELAIISIAMGYGVGRAVRWGSGHRGGLGYQFLAVAITYAGIAGNYTPDVVKGIMEKIKEEDKAQVTATAAPGSTAAGKAAPAAKKAASEPKPSLGMALLAVLFVFAISAAAPFMAGASNIIGMLIILFGLWEAWKINKRVALTVNGPFSVAPSSAGPPNV